ncbi:MAG: LolA-like outer membrane lipoprotein chaperone [Candidatus Marinarcus sp.]|uniref:LolA-like outer membrane lipoprotein chaperone n=1 Tax=Candidatus Marinarcus sp. TaxID=3100987 RepID=UPI003B00A8DC
MFYRIIFFTLFFLSIQLNANVLNGIKTFDAFFTQTIVNSTENKIIYTGKVYIKEPSKILWQYQTPVVKNVYILDNFAIVDEPELEQAIYTNLDKEINLLQLVQKAKKIDETNYTTTLYDVNYTIKIENDKIRSISYKDELENSVVIEFSKIKQNQVIRDDVFQFLPPDSYDIIRK